MSLQYQSGHSTLSGLLGFYYISDQVSCKMYLFFIRKWWHYLVLHGLITKENLSMSRFQYQWDKQQDREVKIETILLVVLMELFWLCFQGSLVHSSQCSRGVWYDSSTVKGSDEEYITSRRSIGNLLVPLPLKVLRAATIWVNFGGENGLIEKKHVRGGRHKVTRMVIKHILFNYVAKEWHVCLP